MSWKTGCSKAGSAVPPPWSGRAAAWPSSPGRNRWCRSSMPCDGRFGNAEIVPVHPRADAAAIRVIVRAVRASRAAMRICPPLVLHDDERQVLATRRRHKQRPRLAFRRLNSTQALRIAGNTYIPLQRRASFWTRKGRCSTSNLCMILCEIDSDFRACTIRPETRRREESFPPTAAEIDALGRRDHSRHQAARRHHDRRQPVPAGTVAGLDGRADREGLRLSRRAGRRHLDQFARRLAGAVAADLQAHPRLSRPRRTRRCWSSSRMSPPPAAT